MRRLSMMLALVFAVVLVMGSVAMAAEVGEPVSNELNADITVTTTQATISVDAALNTAPPVTYTQQFGVSTTPGSYENTPVRVKIETTGDTSGFLLEYQESADSTWHTLNFDAAGVTWYGPTAGFPLADATSQFRVTWNRMGTYDFTLNVFEVDETGAPVGTALATASKHVEVGQALTLAWDLAASSEVTTNVAFDIETTTTKDAVLSQVDRVLYVIEATKDGSAATADDIEAVANGDDGAGSPTVVNVPLGYDAAGGFFYFGDRTNGFTFSAASASTTFTVTIKNPGAYSVKVYAVQLP